MQFLKFTQLLAIALCTLHAAVGTQIPSAMNTTERSLQIDPTSTSPTVQPSHGTPGTNTALPLSSRSIYGPPSFTDIPASTATKRGELLRPRVHLPRHGRSLRFRGLRRVNCTGAFDANCARILDVCFSSRQPIPTALRFV
ncbi:hypothetical protein DFH09DRAFT_1092602 [Mycena vulgaris]|nr:hypothetical protein DFH09DRAFT_1092602 [Mycena vulgaris]